MQLSYFQNLLFPCEFSSIFYYVYLNAVLDIGVGSFWVCIWSVSRVLASEAV